MNELRAILGRLTADPSTPPGVLVTLVTVAGSSYRRPGARLLLTPEDVRLGSISGGCLEEDLIARARRVAATGAAELVTYDTTSENDLVWGVGLGCHGVVRLLLERLPSAPHWAAVLAENQRAHRPTQLAVVWCTADPTLLGTHLAEAVPAGADDEGVFFELIPPPVPLFIFGAGDDAQPLARFAHDLGWRVTVADPRPDYASAARFPTARVVVAPAAELVARAAPSPDALAVVMTHRYLNDVPVLRELLPRESAYVGLLGPKRRAERILADLAQDGLSLTAEQRTRFHAPVGLDLGADTPEEVALSILAEMRAALARRDARPLRERASPIHG